MKRKGGLQACRMQGLFSELTGAQYRHFFSVAVRHKFLLGSVDYGRKVAKSLLQPLACQHFCPL